MFEVHNQPLGPKIIKVIFNSDIWRVKISDFLIGQLISIGVISWEVLLSSSNCIENCNHGVYINIFSKRFALLIFERNHLQWRATSLIGYHKWQELKFIMIYSPHINPVKLSPLKSANSLPRKSEISLQSLQSRK